MFYTRKLQHIGFLFGLMFLLVACPNSSKPSQSFSLSLSNTSSKVIQGSSISIAISVRKQNDFDAPVTLELTGDVDGITPSFAPNPTTSSSTLTLSLDAEAMLGERSLGVKGTSGTLTDSKDFKLTVTESASTPKGFWGNTNWDNALWGE